MKQLTFSLVLLLATSLCEGCDEKEESKKEAGLGDRESGDFDEARTPPPEPLSVDVSTWPTVEGGSERHRLISQRDCVIANLDERQPVRVSFADKNQRPLPGSGDLIPPKHQRVVRDVRYVWMDSNTRYAVETGNRYATSRDGQRWKLTHLVK